MIAKKKIGLFLTILMIMLLVFAGCTPANEGEVTEGESGTEQESQEIENKVITLATTTSTENSGLLDFLLPSFKEDTGIETKVVSVGTGKALKMGENGEADVLLVHAKASEEELVAAGHGLERFDVMYNDFVIIGPEEDAAGLADKSPDNAVEALKNIADAQAKFVSRGDESGTHKKEKKLWEAGEIMPEGDWYVSAGKGMGDVIQMANEMLAYTMSDRATFLAMSESIDLGVLVEGDELLFNQYGVIAVNPEKNDQINAEGAQAFIDWLLSEKAQNLIKDFGVEEYGQPLFIPNAK